MMELFNDINIKCDSCQRTIIIDKQMIDFESFSYDHGDNAMGEEIEYIFQDEIECTCGNIISFRISGYEYPIGAYNYDDNEIYGGVFENEPEIGIIYHSEDFDCFLAESEYDRIDLLIRDILDDINLFYAVSPREFEQIVERFFKNEGFETIDTNTYGQSHGRNGSYSTNWQMAGRELMTPDEVRMMDNQYALLFIRGEKPVKDFKYDVVKHPNIALTTDGGAKAYIHGEDKYSIATAEIFFDEETIKLANQLEIDTSNYVILSEEELEERFKQMEEKQNAKK